jgi:hypothetical protein
MICMTLLGGRALVGCAGDPPSDPLVVQAGNAVQLVTLPSGGASGVYIGDGKVLTNWHVCASDDRTLLFNDPGGGLEPYREGVPLDGFYCDNGRRIELTRPSNELGCWPITGHGHTRFEGEQTLSNDDLAEGLFHGGHVLFAQKTLELCIIQLADAAQSRVPTTFPPLRIALSEVHVGQEVVVASYPLGQPERVEEACRVTATTALLRDPDMVHPSDTEVMSFMIDCETVQHGSSGAPVFDRRTHALLGLVWTGPCEKLGECKPPTYVAAASAWAQQSDRPLAQYSRLHELLETFGVH